MNLLITGASGFLGRYVVARALGRGHRVRGIVRPQTAVQDLSWRDHPSVELRRLDLTCADGIGSALEGMDAVVHLAAAKHGDLEAQVAGTVLTTRNLLEAMAAAGVRRLVVTSSFAVYDYLHLPEDAVVDEDSPLESRPERRDAYARAKLLQEREVRSFERSSGAGVTILRPGVIYGRNNLWTGRLGVRLGKRLWVCIGADATVPLIYVENCAEAIVAAAERDAALGATLNLVDDDLPTQRCYAQAIGARMRARPWIVPVRWNLARRVADVARQCDRTIFRGRLPLPGILVSERLHARCKPLRYENRRAVEALDWKPRYPVQAALDRSCGNGDLLSVPGEPAGERPQRAD